MQVLQVLGGTVFQMMAVDIFPHPENHYTAVALMWGLDELDGYSVFFGDDTVPEGGELVEGILDVTSVSDYSSGQRKPSQHMFRVWLHMEDCSYLLEDQSLN
jgi:hypothetical protein